MPEPLFNHVGDIHCWREDDGRLIGRGGENLGFVRGDSVYDWTGEHRAWWFGDHMRDHKGEVALVAASAGRIGVVKPILRAGAITPITPSLPPEPGLKMKPLKPLRVVGWTKTAPI